MGSFEEKVKSLPVITLDADKYNGVVVEIKTAGIVVSRKLVSIQQLVWAPLSGEGNFTLHFRSLKDEKITKEENTQKGS